MVKSQDLEMIANSIRSKRSVAFMKGLFRTINHLYRECIDRTQTAAGDPSGGDGSDDEAAQSVPTVSLTQLHDMISDGESIITELDMVDTVLEVLRGEKIDGNYLLTISMVYANSLLAFFIFPHRKLQSFLFSLSVETENVTTLQHLLNFRLIMDSTEILDQLGDLEETIGTGSWISLARMDMAKRLGKTETVIESLLKQNRGLELVEYIRANDPTYEIEKLFNQITKFKNLNRKAVWEQVEAWNITPGLKDVDRPVLSHKVVMLNL